MPQYGNANYLIYRIIPNQARELVQPICIVDSVSQISNFINSNFQPKERKYVHSFATKSTTFTDSIMSIKNLYRKHAINFQFD